ERKLTVPSHPESSTQDFFFFLLKRSTWGRKRMVSRWKLCRMAHGRAGTCWLLQWKAGTCWSSTLIPILFYSLPLFHFCSCNF
ncbi:hypothetical protein VIGAN_UM037100, partial [Vigna angularis var. angularis]